MSTHDFTAPTLAKIKGTPKSRVVMWLKTHGLVLIAFSGLLVGALTLRLMTFERFLPFLDYTDETWYYGFAQDTRGLDTVYQAEGVHKAPPLQAFVSGRILAVVDALSPSPWALPSVHMWWLRLWAVVMGLVTTVMVVWAAWQLGGALAGWFAGAIWAFAPQIIDLNSLAIADPYMFMFAAIALATAIYAWRKEAPVVLLISLLSGIGAIYSKYWIASAVLPFAVTALVLFIRQPKKMLPWLIAYGVIAVASAYYLLGVVDPLGSAPGLREVDTFRDEGVRNAFLWDRNWRNFRFAMYPIGGWVFAVTLFLGVLATFYNRRRMDNVVPRWGLIGMVTLYSMVTVMLASTFTVSRLLAGKLRHVLPTTLGLLIIWGFALSQIYIAVRHLLASRQIASRRAGLLAAIIPALILVGHAPGFIAQNTSLIENYNRTYPNEIVWNYTDSSLPREGLVWLEDSSMLATLWNRPWGGYPGNKPFEWWNEPVADLAQQTPQQLIDRNITHLMFTNKDYENRMVSPEVDAFLDQLLLVKTIPVPQDVFMWHTNVLVGVEDVYVYRVLPPENSVDVAFGDAIRLVGYDLTVEDALNVRLYWQADEMPVDNYSLFVHLYPMDSLDMVAQSDQPPVSAQRPTITWDDSNEIYISEEIMMPLPENIESGRYRLALGLYSYTTGARLDTSDPDGFHLIEIEIP